MTVSSAHDQQLLRDLAIINARVLQESGPLPAGGLPATPTRKPVLPQLPLPSVHSETQKDDPMKLSPVLVAASLALNACTPVSGSLDSQRNDQATESQESDSPSLRHKFRVNPNPKRRYDITMTIKDAPGPFGDVGFSAHYIARNCMYWTDKFAGTTARPTHTIAMPFKKLDEVTYLATVYLDAMLDEDYYGDGICHWELLEVAAGLEATGADGETGFGPDISPESIVAKESVTKFFWSEYYPRAGVDNFSEFGSKTLDNVPLEKREKFFTITLSSREVQP